VLSYPRKAGNRFFVLTITHTKISEHIQSRQIVQIILDNLTILLYRGVDLSL
jgi:hypothetical protein